MPAICVTWEVSILDKSIEVIDEQPSNIQYMDVTFEVLKWDKFISVILEHW